MKEKMDLENQVIKLTKQMKEKKGDDDEKDEIIAGIHFSRDKYLVYFRTPFLFLERPGRVGECAFDFNSLKYIVSV